MAGALKTATAIEDSNLKARGPCKIAEAQMNAGDTTGATRTWEQALRTAVAIEKDTQAATLLEIAVSQMAGRDAKGAARTLDLALDAAARISVEEDASRLFAPEIDKAALIALLAATRVDAGDLPGLLAWAETHCNDAVARVSALVGSAVALLRPRERVRIREVSELLPASFN